VTPAGKIERLEVPRDRKGEFVTEVFERYKRMTGDVEEAVLEMYLSGISVRKIAGVTEALKPCEGGQGCRKQDCPSSRRGAAGVARAIA
jgi:putative transposase